MAYNQKIIRGRQWLKLETARWCKCFQDFLIQRKRHISQKIQKNGQGKYTIIQLQNCLIKYSRERGRERASPISLYKAALSLYAKAKPLCSKLSFSSSFIHRKQSHFFDLLFVVMEVNTSNVPSGSPIINTTHRLHSEIHDNHSHFPSKTILTVIISFTSVMVLSAIFLIFYMLRRLKSSNKNGNCKDISMPLHDISSRFISSTALNFNSSPGNS